MGPRTLLLVTGLCFCLFGAARAEPIKDPAAVLPAKLVGYVEIRQPGALMKELAGLLEGSMLADVPDSLPRVGPESARLATGAGALGVFLSPEVFRELGRLDGIAFAVTGIRNDKDMPLECVAIILPGQSNAPGFVFRMVTAGFASGGYATSDGTTRTEGSNGFEAREEVEGVKLYRMVERKTITPAGGAPGKPEVRERPGPTLARMPEAILIGTPEAVKETIHRIKGKTRDNALAGAAAFQSARQQFGSKPGIFFYGNPVEAFALVEKSGLPGNDPEALAAIKRLVNPKAIRNTAGALALENGTLTFHLQHQLNPEEKSPVLSALPTQPLKPEVMQFAARDTLLFAAISTAGGEKRWQSLLSLADALAKVKGGQPLPSEGIAEVERVLGLQIGKDIAGKIDTVAVAMPGMQRLHDLMQKGVAKGSAPLVVLVQATDDQAAEKLVGEILPRAVGTMAGQPDLKPTREKVAGHDIDSLVMPGGERLAFGRAGKMIVLGTEAALVADALTTGSKKQGLGTDERTSASVKQAGDAVVLAVLRPVSLGATLFAVSGPAEPARPGAPVAPDKGTQDLLKLLDAEEPVILQVVHHPDRIQVELRAAGLKKWVPRALDAAIRMSGTAKSFASPAPPTATIEPSKPLSK